MASFEKNTENTIESSSWEDTTELDSQEIAEFLKNYRQTHLEERPRYDTLSELHFSGTNVDVNEKIASGSAKILSVKRFLENGKCEQIHIVFDGEQSGHNIDVYIKGAALKDYLNGSQEKQEVNQ